MAETTQGNQAESLSPAAQINQILDIGRNAHGPLASLRHALENQEFRLAYQPIIDLRSRKPIGLEALLRWPQAGIGPDVFIPMAEHGGLIRDITRCVCHLAAKDWALCRLPAGARLSINLSAADAESMETVALLTELAESLGGGMALSVELTERALLAPGRCKPVLQAIHALGIQIHLDDFGVGYANFKSLIELPLDGIKIDHSLIRHIESSGAARLVIRHLARLAKDLGLTVTTEGVETEAQAQALRSMGIHRAQGWLFGLPRYIEDYPLAS
ncbi:MAG: EAL domain-containing protein [Castellaniella sp.]|uniref:EAL domain-containing protein n=1 Tax=Castellaniella sp. TaxID=1955812 RepID=UPI002A36904D|nr:EAL domain-containing protein [Castellaniella sp.]MDY0309247.1 EAL domain-containing protein [Castellaniella sp.]